MAETLADILADPWRSSTMGQAARAKAEQVFTPARHLERLGELYRSAQEQVAA